MTRQIVTIGLDTAFQEIVRTLLEHALPAVAVIDPAGRPVGVVTTADVITKWEFHGGADLPPFLGSLRRWPRWHKASALTAAKLMTTPAPAIAADTPLHTALHQLADHQLPQLFVVDDQGRLAGVLTHHDTLRAFHRTDAAIHADVERRVPGTITVSVADGVVTLDGTLRLRSFTDHSVREARHVPGVIAVRNNLAYLVDDLTSHGL
ncbi:CBS domain-containing protein [Amycolatopsis sp. NPDC049868]|uniref:CBS domain-containing protein n=1 Tax=Amycolatopsis sp. NPDC049868 TaxID=3363934 RepID=UPI00378B2536